MVYVRTESGDSSAFRCRPVGRTCGISAPGAPSCVREGQQEVGYDPFAKPSRKGRYLRIAVVHGVIDVGPLSAQLRRPRPRPHRKVQKNTANSTTDGEIDRTLPDIRGST